MRTFLLLSLLILTFSQISFAERSTSCPEASASRAVDFSGEMGPGRNQDGDGWCYAFGSADQLTHFMAKRGIGGVSASGPNRVSPVAMALDETAGARRAAYAQYNMNVATRIQRLNQLETSINSFYPYVTQNIELRNPQILRACRNIAREPNGAIRMFRPVPSSSGSGTSFYFDPAADACERARRAGCMADQQCSQQLQTSDSAIAERSQLRSSLPRFEFPAGGVPAEVLQNSISRGLCLESSVASDGFDPRLGVNVNQLLTVNALSSDCEDCRRESSIRAVFPRFQGDIAAILDHFASVDPMSEFMKSCQRIEIPSEQRPRIVNVNPADFSRNLDRPNPEPIGVTYHANIFNFSSNEVAASYATAQNATAAQNRPLHYSLLVGKRYNCAIGEEEFILRNSWGEGQCEIDRNEYASVPKTDPRVVSLTSTRDSCIGHCSFGPGFRTCNENCVNVYSRQNIELNRPPYYCENGHYIIPASLMIRASVGGNRLE